MRKRFWVGALVGVVAVAGMGCSSNSDSGQSGGTTDPASLDFCLHWANDVCRLAYQCADSAAQDTSFHARYGKTQDDCWQSIEPLCASNQSGAQAFGPSCGPGKHVNSAAANTCTDALESDACADWTAAPAGTCDTVCSAAVGNTGGGGSGNGTGGAGSGGTANSSGGAPANPGSLATASDYCVAYNDTLCDRIFECDAAEAAALGGTVESCKSESAATCAGNPCPAGYDATSAAACLAAAKNGPCSQFMSDPPAVCTAACQM